MADTIFALSSGAPPAAIAIVRISGPRADAALAELAGSLPPPRHAQLATLRRAGEVLDRAVVIRFPGPGSVTGEDLVELHLHGGRAIVAVVLEALAELDGFRPAVAGEFTRRAFDNGRVDLPEAEGLADLLSAETQSQRRAAQALAGGALSRQIEIWQQTLLGLSARLEASLDFSDEGEVGDDLPPRWIEEVAAFAAELDAYLARPSVERLRDGVRVVIAGPPNAGKSSLLNWLVGRQAAIVAAIAGTTRDLVEAPTSIAGTPFLLVDTAGLRESDDEVEAIGVGRALDSIAAADVVLWLGAAEDCPHPERAIIVQSKIDLGLGEPSPRAAIGVSAETGEGMSALIDLLISRARCLLPGNGEVALNERHRSELVRVRAQLQEVIGTADHLIAAESLRQARVALDAITGRSGVENMLDALFGRFCIGK
ncbi:tRNA uridine-5-carboxymethylaminomethyl(34) synthesis GTPase MnmE [Allosphingosinicella deserti]|uniref:tRNA modification GTPase MnmE n=1 Tax=Allosphingosinicella deserti TaxID=2116704 RepID=A0A2P7QWA5_9SPHN|nr:tRNA uridine-5-carboxymethylaminomethyl(34) synthesis GTPase MnmE [Sphingomonas deserti]PSJ42240.1 tRNA uridine-5-carboxymethylaminomethyl(34) synthesis GTPase MnmE [Sphingomonas deserti]